MAKAMKPVTWLCIAAAVLAALLYHGVPKDIYLTLAITFGTTAYHLGIRLLVGWIFESKMKNRADYTRPWYQMRKWEGKLYRLLHVKEWKSKLPTYRPENFSPKEHTWDEIAQAMCQSELVHETNIFLSFVPLLASIRWGAFYVFLITSICGAVFDLLFVMIQRYNRPRVVKIALRR